MVSSHACIRVFKQSSTLTNLGFEVEQVARQAPFGFNMFESMSLYFDREQLQRAVKMSKADIFHVHNEPDWMVEAVREVTDRPIIFDAHDLDSLRRFPNVSDDEKSAFECADAFVHVSEPCREHAEKMHGDKKPSIVLYSYMNEVFVKDVGDCSFSSVVYEGGLSEKSELTENTFNLRFYAPVVDEFIKQGFNFYIYPAAQTTQNLYEGLGAVVSQPLHYPHMLNALKAFGYGLLGSIVSAPLMEAAMPNKLFEYMSQGVVPVILNASEASKFATEHGIGITLDGTENLKEQLKDGPKIRKQVLKKRHDFTMEKNIQPLIDLYKGLL